MASRTGALHPAHRFLVERDHLLVISPDDQQGGRRTTASASPGEIRAPAARYDRRDLRPLRRGNQRRGGPVLAPNRPMGSPPSAE
jgi:hypothetical protein